MLSIQTYGLCANISLPLESILSCVAAAGYQGIEPCVAMSESSGNERVFWAISRFEQLAALAASMGLAIPSCHVFCDDLAANTAQMLRLSELFGVRDFVVKAPGERTRARLDQTAAVWRGVADTLRRGGASLLLHNESAEIETKVCGLSACEYLLSQCDGQVGFEPDTGWLWYAGENPVDFLSRYKRSVRLVHLKDFKRTESGALETPIGDGEARARECALFAGENELPIVIDQERFSGDVAKELAALYRRVSSWLTENA